MVGCWAHVRRKFDEALKVLSANGREGSLAVVGKRYCDRLFELEREFAELPPEKRHEKRLETSKPLAKEFFAWANSISTMPKSGASIAARYALSQRKYLERYLDDGGSRYRITVPSVQSSRLSLTEKTLCLPIPHAE